MIRSVSSIVAAGCLLSVVAGQAAQALDNAPRPKLVRRIQLEKKSGRIDQAIPLADGRWAIRDADFLKPETQAVEVYAEDGAYLGKVGTFGRGPGKYFRLRGLDAAADSTLWAADLARVNLFQPSGELVRTILIQNPGYHLTALTLDEERGFFYLAGCLPTRTYLNDGCTLLHQYRLSDHNLVRSFVETDAEALRNNWLPLEWYAIDLDSKGRVYLVDMPVHKLLRVNPAAGVSESFAIRSRQMKPPPFLFPVNTESHEDAYREGFLLDRVVAVGDRVVVSVRKPQWSGYLLQIFDSEGRQIALDLEAPGRLVGKTRDGNLLFADAREFSILEYEL